MGGKIHDLFPMWKVCVCEVIISAKTYPHADVKHSFYLWWPYQIASLFHMYIYMGERIAGKQDRFSLIIEDPLRAPKIPPK